MAMHRLPSRSSPPPACCSGRSRHRGSPRSSCRLTAAPAYAATCAKAQRINLAAGTVVADYAVSANTPVWNIALSTDARSLYLLSPYYGSGAHSMVTTWLTDTNARDSRTLTTYGDMRSIAAVSAVRRPVVPQSGWWWDASRNGTGYAIEVQGNSKAYLGFFTYEPDGRTTWFVANCVLDMQAACTANIDKYSSGATLNGAYQAPTYLGPAGTMTLAFSPSDRATLTLPGGQSTLTRFAIDQAAGIGLAPVWAPQNGWWWAPSESGAGWFIESQNSFDQNFMAYTTMFLVGYMYGADGNPVWYMASAPYTQASTGGGVIPYFQGTLNQFANGPSYPAARAAARRRSARSATSPCNSSQTAATLTLPNGRSLPLERFVIR